MDLGVAPSFPAAPHLDQAQTATPVLPAPWSPAFYGLAATAALQQPYLVTYSSSGVVGNGYLAVQPRQFLQQQDVPNTFLPVGACASVQLGSELDPIVSAAAQLQVLPQHQQLWQHIPQQPWEQQLGQQQLQQQQYLPQQVILQQPQHQQQQQQQALDNELDEPDEGFGDVFDLLDQVGQQYELGKQSQLQGEPSGAAAAVPPGAADMTSAARPYEAVHVRDRQTAKRGDVAAGGGVSGRHERPSLYAGSAGAHVLPGGGRWRGSALDNAASAAGQQLQAQDRRMVPDATCDPLLQLVMPPPAILQVQPQHLQQMHVPEVMRGAPPPWAASWAAPVSRKHPNAQLPARLVANGADSSTEAPPWQQQQHDIWQDTGGYSAPDYGAVFGAAAAADRRRAGRVAGASGGASAGPAGRRRGGSSASRQQQQQQSASARAAAMLQHASSVSCASGGIAGGAPGQGGSRSSPEAYFRRHVQQVDPFWATATPDDVGLVGVTQLPAAAAAAAGSSEPALLSCTMSVLLTNSQVALVKAKLATVQVVCLLVGDAVPHRCHWPPSARVSVNGQCMRPKTAKRTGTQQLKPTQVDSPLDVSSCVGRAASIVQLRGVPNSAGYVLGARLVRRQGPDRVRALMAAPPSLDAALAALKDKLAGDGDVEVSGAALPLRCPLSAGLISQPARFQGSPGLDCFDLDSFLQLAQASGKWQCPQSMALRSVGQLAVDPYLAAVLAALRAAGLGEAVEAVDVAPDGRWRPKGAASGSACPWFSVLRPPSPAELRAAFKGEAGGGGGGKRRRPADSEAPAAAAAGVRGDGPLPEQRQHKRQRRGSSGPASGAAGSAAAVAAAAAAADNGCVDLTMDSDDEQDPAAAAAKPAAPAAPDAGAPCSSAGRSSGLLRMPGRGASAAGRAGGAGLRSAPNAHSVPDGWGTPAAPQPDSAAAAEAAAEPGYAYSPDDSDYFGSDDDDAGLAAGTVGYSCGMDFDLDFEDYDEDDEWTLLLGDGAQQQQQQQQWVQQGPARGWTQQHAAAAAAAAQQRPEVIELLSDDEDD
ncbi:hypothetical protein COO60DRAFT_1699517 [Scenedesmus sp. NREL 46B-D3]|nr:hypothetical protein COO60DRAFT_1699517 [Scenedesmus sp. NREL 46B-D3]